MKASTTGGSQQIVKKRRLSSLSIIALLICVSAVLTFSCKGSLAQNSPSHKATTVVLVHGADADSGSWNSVIPKLEALGYTVIAAANPLRGLQSDSQYVATIVNNIQGPVVLVGHSYGGSVITNAAVDCPNVKALVYVAGLAPDSGESVNELITKYPGSIFPASLAPPVKLPDGDSDLYVVQDKLEEVFAEGLPETEVKTLAATQRPVTMSAVSAPSGTPAWRQLPSWFIYGSRDNAIPPAVHAFMAQRAGAKSVKVVQGAPHLVMISYSEEVTQMILDAIAATTE